MVNEILLESGGTDFILLEGGAGALLLETSAGGGGSGGSSTSAGARSLADRHRQEVISPKRKRLLNAELQVIGRTINTSLEMPLRVTSLLSRPVKTVYVEHPESGLKLMGVLCIPQESRLQVESRYINAPVASEDIVITGDPFLPSDGLPTETYLSFLKEKAMERFYEG